MKTLKIFLFAFFLLGSNYAFSQCCAAGNPDSDDGLTSGGGKNKLNISFGYKYSYSDQYYFGNEPIDFKYVDNSYFHFSSLTATYGVTDKLKVMADIGYFFSKRFSYVHFPKDNAYGLGDASFSVIYKLYTTKKYNFSFFPLVKVTLPVGVFDQIEDMVILPIDLQPSSGSNKLAAGIMTYKTFAKSKFSMNSIFTMEMSQRINTERTNYKYGNLYNFSVAGAYKLNQNINFKLQARYQNRAKASNSDYEIMNSTGGTVIFLSPQVSFGFLKTWRFTAIYDQPVYKNMNGRQLTNKFMFTAKISKTFDFNKTDTSCLFTSVLPADHIVTTLKISGVCEVCKGKIEEICYAQKGVFYANWEVETKILTLKHSEDLKIEKLKKKLAKAGHNVLE